MDASEMTKVAESLPKRFRQLQEVRQDGTIVFPFQAVLTENSFSIPERVAALYEDVRDDFRARGTNPDLHITLDFMSSIGLALWLGHQFFIVAQIMSDALKPIVTPLASGEDYTTARLVGTGSYIHLAERKYLLTCEHVLHKHFSGALSYLPVREKLFHRIPLAYAADPPIDIALAPVNLPEDADGQRAIHPLCLDGCVSHDDAEIYSFIGYPGVGSRYSAIADGLISSGFPMSFTRVELPETEVSYDSHREFALTYPGPEMSVPRLDGSSDSLPDPHGMSGSAVWNTRYFEIGADKWDPSHARVCGVLKHWPEVGECLVATRIEIVREVLLGMIRSERAYESWLQRGRPQGDDWSDWFSVVQAYPNFQSLHLAVER